MLLPKDVLGIAKVSKTSVGIPTSLTAKEHRTIIPLTIEPKGGNGGFMAVKVLPLIATGFAL